MTLFIHSKKQSNGAHRSCTTHREISAFAKEWLIVPPELEEKANKYLPFVNLSLDENGNIIDITEDTKAREAVELEAKQVKKEPTLEERNRADIDYLAILQGVDLENV